MLKLDVNELGREIEEARTHISRFLQPRAKLIASMMGRHYRVDTAGGATPAAPAGEADPENYAFSYKAWMRPQLCYGIPTCKVEPRRSIADRDLAQGLEDLLNSWAHETDWKGTLGEVIDDVCMGFAVTKVTVQPRGDYSPQDGTQPVAGEAGMMPGMAGMPGMMPEMGLLGPTLTPPAGPGGDVGTDVGGDFQQRPNYPAVVRVDPDTFFVDPQARTIRKARFMGHTYERDLEDVQADPRLDPNKVKTLVAPDVLTRTAGTQAAESDITNSSGTDRKRITLYELYLPEHRKIMTLARSQGGDGGTDGMYTVLRDEAYFGPDDGPYDLWGLDSVTGEMIPISPLQALWDNFTEVNIHARAASRSAATHKKIGVYLQSNVQDAATINNTPSGSLAGVTDPASVKELELGGASDLQLQWLMYLRGRAETHLGFTDAQRGLAQANKTATGEQIADKNSDIRVDLMRDRVRDNLRSVYGKVGWYFWNDSSIGRVEFMNDSGQFMWVAGQWHGGFAYNRFIPPEPDRNFDSVLLTIDGDSMSKQDDPIRQKRAQDMATLVFSVLLPIYGPQLINMRGVLDMWGRANNIPNFSKMVLLDQVGMMIPPDILNRPPHQPGQPTMGGLPGRGMFGGGAAGGMRPAGPGRGVGTGGATMPGILNASQGGMMAGVA